MVSLFETESVTVLRPVADRDDLGEPAFEDPERDEVSGVLVQPGATSDLDATRPNGVRVALTLHFPKGYGRPLRGCSIELRGEVFDVVGDPSPYTEGNVPVPWTMPVEVSRSDG